MNQAFVRAAGKFDVPRDLLAAVGYGETHLDGHTGRPSQANGYGVMHLASNPANRTLEKAADITGEPLSRLRRDTAANILGGAAVLRSYADRLGLDGDERDDIDAWYPAVAQYSGSTGRAAARYADTVYAFLAQGFAATVPGGEQISVAARPVAPVKGTLSATAGRAPITPYPSALWVPADSHNFTVGRTATIDKVIIHVTQGSYAGSIKWFQDPTAEVSAHYVVRSSDGQITQTVRDSDTAYHAKQANASALGIEHEGYIDDPSWFTDTMYRASAALARALCDKYGIPKDRAHIIGHSEAPGTDHTDPGRYWEWNRYMGFVEGDSSSGSGNSTGGSSSGSGGSSSSDGLGFASYTLLQSGASGAQVTAVQQLLNTQGYASRRRGRGLRRGHAERGEGVPDDPRAARGRHRRAEDLDRSPVGKLHADAAAGRLGRRCEAAPAVADRGARHDRGRRRDLRSRHGDGGAHLPDPPGAGGHRDREQQHLGGAARGALTLRAGTQPLNGVHDETVGRSPSGQAIGWAVRCPTDLFYWAPDLCSRPADAARRPTVRGGRAEPVPACPGLDRSPSEETGNDHRHVWATG